MWTHLGHFVGAVIGIFFNAIGSTLLGLLIDGAFAVSIAVATLHRKRRAEGWRAMLRHWRDEYRAGLKFAVAAAVVIYSPVLIWSVGRAVYEDHQGLVERSHKQRQTIQRDAGTLQDQMVSDAATLNGCQNQNARIGGQNDALNKQNRDQQDTINHCQEDAIKLLAPVPQKTTPVFFDKDESKTPNQMRWILLTNASVSPIHMVVECNAVLDSVSVGPINEGFMGGGITRLSPRAWQVSIDTPAWTPTSPLLAIITYYRSGDVACSFNVR